jgi:hypothetical protein
MSRRSNALVAELCLMTLLVAAVAAAMPLDAGYLAWSWDALNHHIYLGLVAEAPSRLQRDVIAAGSQSYQYPYLYWPIYRLSLLDSNGALVGAVWAAFQAALLVPPIWIISLRLLPTRNRPLIGVAERLVSCSFAFLSTIVLMGLETTSNDLLAAVPLLWAFAVMAELPTTNIRAALAAGLWGVSAAFKLSNAIFVPLLLLWWWMPAGTSRVLPTWRRGVAVGGGATLGFGLTYAPWGWQLWQLTGNPAYPYLASLFGSTTGF